MLPLAAVLSCSDTPTETPEATMIELPPFDDSDAAQVYDRLSAWADAQGWSGGPLRRAGSRLERTWRRGEPGKGLFAAPGTARIDLSVFAGSTPTHSYGLQWRAAASDDHGHGLRLMLVAGAGRVTPDQLRIDLQQGDGAPIELGAPLTWTLGERVLETARPHGLAEVQARLSAYLGAGVATEGARDLDALEAVVRPVLDAGDYTVCDYGPSPGRGIPGPCLPRAPTAAEREAHAAAFESELVRRRRALDEAEPWMALLTTLAPSP